MQLQCWFLVDRFRRGWHLRAGAHHMQGMLGWGMLPKHQLCWQPSCCAVQPLCFWGCGLGSCLMNPSLQVRRHVQGHTEIHPRASRHTWVCYSTWSLCSCTTLVLPCCGTQLTQLYLGVYLFMPLCLTLDTPGVEKQFCSWSSKWMFKHTHLFVDANEYYG